MQGLRIAYVKIIDLKNAACKVKTADENVVMKSFITTLFLGFGMTQDTGR